MPRLPPAYGGAHVFRFVASRERFSLPARLSYISIDHVCTVTVCGMCLACGSCRVTGVRSASAEFWAGEVNGPGGGELRRGFRVIFLNSNLLVLRSSRLDFDPDISSFTVGPMTASRRHTRCAVPSCRCCDRAWENPFVVFRHKGVKSIQKLGVRTCRTCVFCGARELDPVEEGRSFALACPVTIPMRAQQSCGDHTHQ